MASRKPVAKSAAKPAATHSKPAAAHSKPAARASAASAAKPVAAQSGPAHVPASEALQNLLMQLHGIGPAGAEELAARLRADGRNPQTESELRAVLRAHYATGLSAGTAADLQYNFARAIPRSTIDVFAAVLDTAAAPLYTRNRTYAPMICGSYRRGSTSPNDIDLVVLASDWPHILAAINAQAATSGVRVHPAFSSGPSREEMCVTIAAIAGVTCNANIKMDVFLTKPAEWAYAVVYATGSKENNLRMRMRAKARGLLLNQAGLFQADKTSIRATTEEQIYDHLGMKYLEPSAR